MTGFKSKRAAALDEDGMYLVHHTAQQDATMQSLKDLKRSVCDEVGKAAFAQPAQEPDAYGYARRLAEYIWAAHYRVTAPQWKPLDDLMGVLTQIDNMTSGLVTLPAAQPAQEPVAWPCVIAEANFEQNTITLEMQCSNYKVGAGQHWLYTTPPQPAQERNFCPRCGKRTADLTTIHTCTPPQEKNNG